jgi:multicomponent Na+:H+ antiporter subunit E
MNRPRIRTVVVRAAALLALWLVLTLTLDPFYFVLGLLAALAVAWLNTGTTAPAGLRWSGLAVYLPWLLWQVLLSGRHVAYLILHPRLPIEPALIRYTTGLEDPVAIVILGNSITLTPGTITADVQGNELTIHAMDAAAASGLADMERKIASAFGVSRREGAS